MGATQLPTFGGRLLAGIGLILWETPLAAQADPPAAGHDTARTSSSTQTADAPARAADDAEASTGILVTATRRPAPVQEVPLSVTAVTGQSLQQNNIQDLSRLDALVPGLRVGTSGPDARPAIRGTRTQQVVGNADPQVAFYSDGIYRSRPSQALATFLDVDRVEVLRGPQGTLFGRNTFSGAINVITRAPTLDDLAGGGMAEITNHEGIRVEGFANVPIGDTVAVRLSGYVSHRDGWVSNSGRADNDLHDDENQVVRGQVLFEPSSTIRNLFRAEYWHGGGAGPGAFGYFTPGVPVNLATGFTNGVSGVINPVISAGTAGNPLVAGRPNYDGGLAGLAPGTMGDADYRHISRNFPARRRIRQLTLSNEFTAEIAGFADFNAILSFTDYDEYRQGDADFSSQLLFYENNRNRARTYSEELQLVSNRQGPLSWIAGLYFLQDRPTAQFSAGTDTGTTPIELYSADPINGFFAGPNGSYTDSYAAYADATYEVTDRLNLFGGLRYTVDRKRGFNNSNAGITLPATSTITARESFDRLTYRAGLQFEVAEQVMLYGSYSTGFLAGGLNADSVPITAFTPTYSSAFEAGAKGTLLNGRLRGNLAFYRNRYRDIITQILQFLPGGAVITTSANAGAINAYGAEAEVDFNPTRVTYLGLRLSYNHSRFGEFIAPNSFHEGGNILAGNCTAFCPFQLRGLQVPLNPTFTATLLASADIDAGELGLFTPSATAFVSSRYRTSDQPYFFANQAGYATVDLRLGWRPSARSSWNLAAFVTNLTDHRILLRSTPNSGSVAFQNFADPRIYGLRVAFNY
jgi:iron complex outermembrane recepter protein